MSIFAYLQTQPQRPQYWTYQPLLTSYSIFFSLKDNESNNRDTCAPLVTSYRREPGLSLGDFFSLIGGTRESHLFSTN